MSSLESRTANATFDTESPKPRFGTRPVLRQLSRTQRAHGVDACSRGPLFNPIDADEPLAAVPTYEHLKKGLVRVVLSLPDTMDLIDFSGNVVTPADRTLAVWRAVPTVENTAITAPYQYDGREATLPERAQAAIIAHSQGGAVARKGS